MVHPNWWGQPPAILKGWVDRVIRPGVAYEFLEGDSGEGVPNGLLKARAALVFNTSNTRQEREREVFGDPLETIWKNCIFGLCGVPQFHRRMVGIVVTSTASERQTWLDAVRNDVETFFRRNEDLPKSRQLENRLSQKAHPWNRQSPDWRGYYSGPWVSPRLERVFCP